MGSIVLAGLSTSGLSKRSSSTLIYRSLCAGQQASRRV